MSTTTPNLKLNIPDGTDIVDFTKFLVANFNILDGAILNNSSTIQVDASGNVTIAGNITLKGQMPVENWTAITLQNSWVAYNTVVNAFYKNKSNEVKVKGIIKNGTGTSGTVLFTLPAGYRPKEIKYCIGIDGALAVKRIQINPDGTVTIVDGCNNTFLILDNISFLAEQ